MRRNERLIVLQMSDDTTVAGAVMLDTPDVDTSLFRAYVEKLVVDPGQRRKGIAQRLMVALEKEALSRGETLIVSSTQSFIEKTGLTRCEMLSTTKEYVAEHMYPKLGFIEFGRTPQWTLSPLTGQRMYEIWLYKDL